MKTRTGFVSNSSSTSFIITNTSNKPLTLVDFVVENREVLNNFNFIYGYDYKLSDLIKDAENLNITFEPNSSRECVFGDEDGNTIGHVYDYGLRDNSPYPDRKFTWQFKEHLR